MAKEWDADERTELAELREKVAYLRAGVLNLDRDSLVQAITAVGSSEWRNGHWLSEHDQQVREQIAEDLAQQAADAPHAPHVWVNPETLDLTDDSLDEGAEEWTLAEWLTARIAHAARPSVTGADR